MSHPIADHLYKIQAQTGDHFFKLFDDWLSLTLAAFCKQPGEDDEPYMAIMRKYGPRITGRNHPADHFARALGEFTLACQRESALNGVFPDYLGRIYEEEALANRYAGQFFTPEPLCQLMTQMTVTPTEERISIADPACGSGRFFIAAMPLAPNATFYGTDRDFTCVKMTALNMLMRRADSYVVHGNTLSMECWGGYATECTPWGGQIRALGAGTALAILTRTAQSMAVGQPKIIPDPAPAPTVEPGEPEPDANAPIVIVEDKKGQFGFVF